MLFPILFVVGLTILGLRVGESMRASQKQPVVGRLPPPKPRAKRPVVKVSAVDRLWSHVQNGVEPSPWLVTEAMGEAFDKGDWDSVSEIADMFGEPEPEEVAEGTPVEQTSEEQPMAQAESPLEHVESEDWISFTEALATKDSNFQNDKYVGKYEQSRARLRQLGIEVPASEEDQVKALATDMSSYWDSEAKLIQDFAGETVDIKGHPHAITPSGILGLLKSAGPQGARSWLSNDTDRDKFPRTTETFIRTNGCF